MLSNNLKVYAAARSAWHAADALRRRRRRFKNYTYGRQWSDPVTTPDGRHVTEGEYASMSGKMPLTNNMIRQLVKSVIGRFRYQLSQQREQPDASSCSAALRAVAERNQLDELDCRLLEEFLISGCAVQRIVAERRPGGREDVWIDNVSPGRFFVNRFTDPRGSDIELVGMLHDMSLREVIMRFGHGDASAARRITDIYSRTDTLRPVDLPPLGEDVPDSFDEAAPGRCRVIEVWTLEGRDLLRCHDPADATTFLIDRADRSRLRALNRRRLAEGREAVVARPFPSLRWHGYFFAPGGRLLDHTESPYPHGSHPFAVKLYPLVDGEVHPFVEDIIDQQRYINRLITLIDHIMSFSAKGVLLFPEDQKPEDLTWDDIARQWTQPNGVIPYLNSGGAVPAQAYSSPASVGAYELLGIEMKLFEQISGVSGALQGRSPDAGTGAQLYDAQIRNAAIALADTFETFNSFRRLRDAKVCRTARVSAD